MVDLIKDFGEPDFKTVVLAPNSTLVSPGKLPGHTDAQDPVWTSSVKGPALGALKSYLVVLILSQGENYGLEEDGSSLNLTMNLNLIRPSQSPIQKQVL